MGYLNRSGRLTNDLQTAVGATATADLLYPGSALGTQHESAVLVGSGVALLGLSLVAGYHKDAMMSTANDHQCVHRFSWGSSFVILTLVSGPFAIPVEASLCGLVAGLLITYTLGRRHPGWSRKVGLGLQDLGLQCALFVLLLLSRNAQALS